MGNCILLIASRERERKRGKKEGKRGEEDCSPEEILATRTQHIGTWHWPKEILRPAGAAAGTGSAFIYLRGKEGRGAGVGGRVQAEVDGRGPGLLQRREPRTRATALRTARSSCAPENASPLRGPAGDGKVCAKRSQLVAPKCTRRSWK